jgi:Zn-dependent membrane protease YugP
MFFDPWYFIIIAPALLLAMWAQMRIRSAYAAAMQQPAPMSGAAAAQHILNSAGVEGVRIEEVPGHLSDHYDPREKVLRLSSDVYHTRSLAAVGIAAHEVGHALQHAYNYAPLVVRNAAVPLAGFGSNASLLLLIVGAIFSFKMLIWLGIAAFAAVVFFQVVNLPVEFNASSRAKKELVSLGIIDQEGLYYVDKVLDAAAMTYVAATLQAILTLLYYIMRFTGGSSRQ